MKSLHIQVYTSFITTTHLYVKGRILKDSPLLIKGSHGIFSSLIHTIIRAWSREIKCHPVECRIGDKGYAIKTDDEGYFEVYENIENQDVHYRSIEVYASYKNRSNRITVDITDYSQNNKNGIISDIDDTVMVTGVKSFFKIKVVLNTLFLNPFRRKPIEAAATAFHFLSDDSGDNGPVIYLSNSPWNLFIYLKTFLGFNKFPEGIVILRDMGWQLLKSKEIEEKNKYIEIEKLLIAFSENNFTLLGDTGELDFDIYKTIENKYPDRILKVILNKARNRKQEYRISQYQIVNRKFRMVTGYSTLLSE